MTPGRRRRVDNIPEEQTVIVGVNIRTLRQRKGWTQAKLGELMGWQNASTVCAAEGRRDGRQRGFTAGEIERLVGKLLGNRGQSRSIGKPRGEPTPCPRS